MSDSCRSRWFRGLTCDHLYANCPNLRRGEAELRRYDLWDGDGDGCDGISKWIDPHQSEVCGMCAYRHTRSAECTTDTANRAKETE